MLRAATVAAMLATPILLSACAGSQSPQMAESAVSEEVRATIQSIDPVTRQVVLRRQDGSILSLTAGPEIRNFDQLEPGDTVVAMFEEYVSVRLAEEGDIAETVGVTMARRAPEGARPGAAAATAISTVVTFVSYDPETAIVTFTLPEGETLSRLVAPGVRDFVAAREPGDRVFAERVETVAIGIEEVDG